MTALPALITDLRTRAGLTQPQCAQMTLAGLRTWKHWEAGTRSMPLAAMELWCLAILAGGHLPLGDWVEPWLRHEFRVLFERQDRHPGAIASPRRRGNTAAKATPSAVEN